MIERHTTAWHEALDAYVHHRMNEPFAWGEHDCFTFAAGWVLLARGKDPMEGVRGYADEREAMAALRAAGGIEAAVTQRMGESLAGAMAQAGDTALVRHGVAGRSMGVCVGAHIAAPGPTGIVLVPLTEAELAWRV